MTTAGRPPASARFEAGPSRVLGARPVNDTLQAVTQSTLWDKVQSYSIVTLITVLIWLYAESENVKQQKPLEFKIHFAPPASQDLAIDDPILDNVRIIVRCTTGQYARLREMLDQPLELTVSREQAVRRARLDEDGPPGPRPAYDLVVPVDVQDWLESSAVGELGVSFVDVQPASVDLQVAVFERVSLPVSADRLVDDPRQLASPPILERGEATMQIPLSYLEDIDGNPIQPQIKLQVRPLKKEFLETLDENVPRKLAVPLEPPVALRDGWWLAHSTINPPNVEVTVTIRNQTDNLELSSVPIWLAAPWSQLQRYSVVLENDQFFLLKPISIAGPSDVIAKIRDGQVKVWAELRLSADDLETRINSAQIYLNVPANVQIESAIPVVHFTITPREPSVPTPANPGG